MLRLTVLVAATFTMTAPTVAAPPVGARGVLAGPGIPPHVSAGLGNWQARPTPLPVRPVHPIHRPGFPGYPGYPGLGWGWQPWLNRGWVNTIGIVPGNVYYDGGYYGGYYGQGAIDPSGTRSQPAGGQQPPVVTSPAPRPPVTPQVLEFNKETGRLEKVSPQGASQPPRAQSGPKVVVPPSDD